MFSSGRDPRRDGDIIGPPMVPESASHRAGGPHQDPLAVVKGQKTDSPGVVCLKGFLEKEKSSLGKRELQRDTGIS